MRLTPVQQLLLDGFPDYVVVGYIDERKRRDAGEVVWMGNHWLKTLDTSYRYNNILSTDIQHK